MRFGRTIETDGRVVRSCAIVADDFTAPAEVHNVAERKGDEAVTVSTSARFGDVATASAEAAPKAPKRPARPVEGVDRDALRSRVMAKFPRIRARLGA